MRRLRLFVDTSALLAVIDGSDLFHPKALAGWKQWLTEDVVLVTSNYVILETTALVQRRIGMEAVALLHEDILPVLRVEWAIQDIHRNAVAALLAARRRDVSLVDYTSFELMRQFGLRVAFAFDHHFAEQGFEVVP